MSNFHKLAKAILQKATSKENAKKIFYRDYKAFGHLVRTLLRRYFDQNQHQKLSIICNFDLYF